MTHTCTYTRTAYCFLALLTLVSLGSAQNASSTQSPGKPLTLSQAAKNQVIYVADFELDPSNFKQDKGGILGKGTILPPPPGLPKLRRKPQDPAIAGQKMVELMAKTLVSELRKAGLTAYRLLPGYEHRMQGLLVTGVFTEVDEGNQMRRALLGFGSGKSKIELYVTVADLSKPGQPLYAVSTQKNSGRKPGAVITLSPYAIPVKVALTKSAPEKTVKKTASWIAAEMSKQLNADTLVAKN